MGRDDHPMLSFPPSMAMLIRGSVNLILKFVIFVAIRPIKGDHPYLEMEGTK